MGLSELSISKFCEEVAKDSAVPAGGCVSALSAALGAALLEMSALFTLRKAAKNGVPVDKEISVGCGKVSQSKIRLQALIDEDAAAFDAVTLPKDTDEQKKVRMDAAQSAYRQATATLTEVVQIALELMPFAAAVIKKGDPAIKSDAIVGIRMLHSGLFGAVSGIRSNLCCIKDANQATVLARQVCKAETDAEHFLKVAITE